MWWHAVVPCGEGGRRGKGGCEFVASVSYIVRLCLKNQNQTKNKEKAEKMAKSKKYL